MRITPVVLVGLISLFLIQSCSKEKSFELSGPLPVDSLGSVDCRIDQVITVDTVTGRGATSLATVFGSDDVPSSITYYDSATNSVLFQTSVRRQADTLRLAGTEYAVLDSIGRIRIMHTYSLIDSSALDFYYEYDQQGYLVRKTAYDFLPGYGDLAFEYKWTDSNLTRVDGKLITGIFDVPLYESTLEYHQDQSAPGFLYVLPEAYELVNYLLAVNVGKKSKNLVRKVRLQISDLQGESETYITEFSDYTFTSSGLVAEFMVRNNTQDPLFLINGKTRLAYRCK